MDFSENCICRYMQEASTICKGFMQRYMHVLSLQKYYMHASCIETVWMNSPVSHVFSDPFWHCIASIDCQRTGQLQDAQLGVGKKQRLFSTSLVIASFLTWITHVHTNSHTRIHTDTRKWTCTHTHALTHQFQSAEPARESRCGSSWNWAYATKTTNQPHTQAD